MNAKERAENFKKELKALCAKYRICIEGRTSPGLYCCHLADSEPDDIFSDIDSLPTSRLKTKKKEE